MDVVINTVSCYTIYEEGYSVTLSVCVCAVVDGWYVFVPFLLDSTTSLSLDYMLCLSFLFPLISVCTCALFI